MMRARFLTVVAVLALATGACGVRTDSEPRRIDPETVPFGLLDRTQGAPDAPAGADHLALYFVGSDRLVEVSRATVGPLGPRGALQQLLRGPTRQERAAGLTTALPSRAAATFHALRGPVAVVQLAAEFQDGTIPNQVTALSQIVYTLTAIDGIERVRFLVNDRPVSVPRADGSIAEQPVTRDDYAALLSTPPS